MKQDNALEDFIRFIKDWNQIRIDPQTFKKWGQIKVSKEDIEKILKR